MNTKQYLALLISCLATLSSFAQDDFRINNSDRLLIAGTDLFFEIQLAEDNNALIGLSLFDAESDLILKQLFSVSRTNYSGCFNLSSDLNSGTYVLAAINLSTKKLIQKELIHVLNPVTFDLDQITKDSSVMNFDVTFKFKNDPLTIRGHVLSPSKNSVVIMQTRGQEDLFFYTPVSADGFFTFLQPILGNVELYFTHSDGLKLDNHIKIDDLPYPKTGERVESVPYPLPKNLLNDESLRDQLTTHYFQNKGGKEIPQKNSAIEYDRTIVLADYFEQRSMKEVINEIVPLKKLKITDNSSKLFLLNSETSQYYKVEPLYLIDGFIVNSLEDLLNLDPKSVEKIELSYHSLLNESIMGRFAYSGILSVNTFDKKFLKAGTNSIRIQGIVNSNCN